MLDDKQLIFDNQWVKIKNEKEILPIARKRQLRCTRAKFIVRRKQSSGSVASVQDGLLWQRHLNKSSSGFLGAKRGRIGQRLIKPIESLHLAESLLPARSELVSPKKFRKG